MKSRSGRESHHVHTHSSSVVVSLQSKLASISQDFKSILEVRTEVSNKYWPRNVYRTWENFGGVKYCWIMCIHNKIWCKRISWQVKVGKWLFICQIHQFHFKIFPTYCMASLCNTPYTRWGLSVNIKDTIGMYRVRITCSSPTKLVHLYWIICHYKSLCLVTLATNRC